MKISIIGYSGSGKSTLARNLGELYGAPVLHLDTVHFLPGWVEKQREDENREVKEFLDGNDSWVIDGNYSKMEYGRRMEESDRIIFMNFNRVACFLRAWKRYRENMGKTRESMAAGCEEKMDRTFMKWILYEGRTKKRKQAYQKVKSMHRDKFVEIRNQRELDQFVEQEMQRYKAGRS